MLEAVVISHNLANVSGSNEKYLINGNFWQAWNNNSRTKQKNIPKSAVSRVGKSQFLLAIKNRTTENRVSNPDSFVHYCSLEMIMRSER